MRLSPIVQAPRTRQQLHNVIGRYCDPETGLAEIGCTRRLIRRGPACHFRLRGIRDPRSFLAALRQKASFRARAR